MQLITETGSGSVHEKEKAFLAKIIANVNDLFEGKLTEDDKLVYVNNVIKGKPLESEGAGAAGRHQHERTIRQFARSGQRHLYAIMAP